MSQNSQQKKKKALVRMYSWSDLTRLATKDMCSRLGVPFNEDTEFHYMGGVDARGNPFIRLDLTPIAGSPDLVP